MMSDFLNFFFVLFLKKKQQQKNNNKQMKPKAFHFFTAIVCVCLLLTIVHWLDVGYQVHRDDEGKIHNRSMTSPWRWSNGICQRGRPLFSHTWIKAQLPSFLRTYNVRPGHGNRYGTSMMHQFALWCIIHHIKPRFIIESGVNLGLGTWIIRQAAPTAKLILLDPKNRTNMVYRDNSELAVYMIGNDFQDFGSVNWRDLVLPEETLIFIDDHQEAFDRIDVALQWGFKRLVFDDNYWNGGDVFSIKKACTLLLGRALGSLQWTVNNNNKKGIKFKAFANTRRRKQMLDTLTKNVDLYYEFPLLWKAFGTNTNSDNKNILHKNSTSQDILPKYFKMSNYPPDDEINYYCNIAYLRLSN